jgi:multiple antibiotic resistance protein
MTDNLGFALLCFTSFFSLMNPLGVMPVFITMTSNLEPADQRRTARKAMITAFLTLLAFAFSGQLLFNFFGISVNSFRIVGGIIFFQMGADMLQARLGKVKVPKHEIEEYVADISITPLAIPMICGPGCISNAIVLMEDASSLEQQAILIGIMSVVCLITYIILFSSIRISAFLGETGNNVLMRLMGLILMVIAVEFFLSGAKPILADIFPAITAKL